MTLGLVGGNMLKVYVCEDITVQREKIKKIVENIILMEDLDMELAVVTGDPEEMLEVVKQSGEVGIYFLDIDLKAEMDGMELAKEIRKYDPRGFVIFITTHSEMSYMTFIYKLEAMDYIVKDDETEIGNRIYQCMLGANERFASANNKVQDVYSIKINEKLFTINYEDILFFETSPNVHKVILHCKNRVLEFYGKINELEKSLDERFYRCHRSYLVNKDNIKEIDLQARVIYMENGEQCLVSSRMMRGLKK